METEGITPNHDPSVASFMFYREAMRLWREAKTDEDRQDFMVCLEIASSCALVSIAQSLNEMAQIAHQNHHR